MRLRHFFFLFSVLFLLGCAPSIRFKPGELPTPISPDPAKAEKGKTFFQRTLVSGKVVHDPQTQKRVSDIVSRLLDATPPTGHWRVAIVNENSVNALTSPGNYIFVYKGLLDTFPDDSEVAAILAHEIGHRLAQHEEKTEGESLGEAIAVIASIAAATAVGLQKGATAQDVDRTFDATRKLGMGFTTFRYSKDKEREADQIGMFLAADAGFDPQGSASVWRKLLHLEGNEGSDFMNTHPNNADRYAQAMELMPLAQARYEKALEKQSKKKKTKAKPVKPQLVQEVLRGEEALRNNDLETASSIAQSLTRKAPSFPLGFNLLGLVRAKEGETPGAQRALRQALKLEPDNPTLIYNAACVHALAGQHTEALQSLEKAFTMNPALVGVAKSDSDLQSLWTNPEFERLTTKDYVLPAPLIVGGNTLSVNSE